ncbi:MAG TPA: MarR family transcriptional regulator [Pseudonocardiaceae bacterium]
MNEAQAARLESQIKRFHRRRQRERPQVTGLSSSSVVVLGLIARAERSVQPGDIAEELGMASSNVAAALRELDAAGYIARARDAEDKRRIRVSLTQRGVAAVAAHRSLRIQWLRTAVEATLTEREQAVLIEAGALLERLAGYQPAPAEEMVARS